MLERVKAFEHRKLRIASCTPKARDERAVLHASMIARRTFLGRA